MPIETEILDNSGQSFKVMIKESHEDYAKFVYITLYSWEDLEDNIYEDEAKMSNLNQSMRYSKIIQLEEESEDQDEHLIAEPQKFNLEWYTITQDIFFFIISMDVVIDDNKNNTKKIYFFMRKTK